MSRIGFYLIFPILYLVSLFPFPLLYLISDLLYLFVYKIVGYRTKVVRTNLKNSFPEYDDQRLRQIEKKFYAWLCDLFMEVLKGMTMSKKSALKRVKMVNPEVANQFFDQGRSAIWILGHRGNWEWAIFSSDLYTKYPMNIVYHKLSNPGFEWMMKKMRARFGSTLIPMAQTLRHLISNKKETHITALVCDQTPKLAGAYWTTFLNQDTAFFTGPEKIGKMLNPVLLYLSIDRVKRGYYELNIEILNENPKESKDGEITEAIAHRIEQDIRRTPEFWLWSHRRWKHKRPDQS